MPGSGHYLQSVSPSLHFLRAMACCLSMFWENLESTVSAKDWSLFQNLRDPESGDCIYDHPDYHAIIVYTLFHAKVPARGLVKEKVETPVSKDKKTRRN